VRRGVGVRHHLPVFREERGRENRRVRTLSHPAQGVAARAQSPDRGLHRDHRPQGAHVQAVEGAQATDQQHTAELTANGAERLYYRIGEVEGSTGVPAYVLRYWESEFKLLRPKKNPAGQRVYRRRDLELVQRIKSLLYDERLTLEGAKKRLLAESRRAPEQLQLGLKEVEYAGALRRIRERLTRLRARLTS